MCIRDRSYGKAITPDGAIGAHPAILKLARARCQDVTIEGQHLFAILRVGDECNPRKEIIPQLGACEARQLQQARRAVENHDSAIGGDVQRISRQSRWRPVWFADMERNGETLALCVRGERTDMPMIFPLDHEMRFQSLLQERNIPVARVHGWIDDPRAYVMDRVPGSEDFSATPQEERQAVVDDYLQILARIHPIDAQRTGPHRMLQRVSPAPRAALAARRQPNTCPATPR